MESEKIRAEFTADPGSKMVSLIGKDSGYEFLLQRDGKQYRDQPFEGVFIDGECSGFDEMFLRSIAVNIIVLPGRVQKWLIMVKSGLCPGI